VSLTATVLDRHDLIGGGNLDAQHEVDAVPDRA
jgi:hypothetical protein